MKYKLLKNLPHVTAGFIGTVKDNWISFTIGSNQYNYPADTVNSNPDYFASYLFTTEDGVDIFSNDWFYIFYPDSKIEKAKFMLFTEKSESYKYFSTKEVAEQYVESLKPKFKTGDIVVTCNGIGKVIRIETAKDINKNDYLGCLINYGDYRNSFQDLRNIRLADSKEIIKYYEQQGWIKGAKFKVKECNVVEELEYLEVYKNQTVRVFSKHGTTVLGLCELIKEPDYPKSWEELKGVVGYEINSDLVSNSFLIEPLNDNWKSVYSTKKQASSALAFAQLTQLQAAVIKEYNKVNNCDWKPNWNNHFGTNWTVSRVLNDLEVIDADCIYHPLAFPTKELAEFALDNWRYLWEQYYEL